MEWTIVILIDYQKSFSTKWAAKPYRSGMDIDLIRKTFLKQGYKVDIKSLSDIDFRNDKFENNIYLYSSSEDESLYYKSYIEDIILGLELRGANLITPYYLLRAHHNKVFMEILRDLSSLDQIKNLRSKHFGTFEEFKSRAGNFKYPVVIKEAAGASSLGVQKANNVKQGIQKVSTLSRSRNIFFELWDLGRSYKHTGYQKESKHRKKFVVQQMLPDLTKDWKVLVFGTKYYILERSAKSDDFRASGSGILEYPKMIPDGLFDFAEGVYKSFEVPFFAMDIGLSNDEFVLIEFQAIHFGTHTLDTSPFFYQKINGEWKRIEERSIVELELAHSVDKFIKTKFDGLE